MGSARLPGKSLRPLAGRPLIAHVIERAKALPVDEVVLATSMSEKDDRLADEVRRHGQRIIVRASEHDVLERVTCAAVCSQADVIVRVTGDCPLLAPDVGARVIEYFLRTREERKLDYCWNDTSRSGYPDGTDIEVFSIEALEYAFIAATGTDREHVTSWIREHMLIATVMNAQDDWSRLKLSVDTLEDYQRVAAILAHVPAGSLDLRSTVEAAMKAGVLVN